MHYSLAMVKLLGIVADVEIIFESDNHLAGSLNIG